MSESQIATEMSQEAPPASTRKKRKITTAQRTIHTMQKLLFRLTLFLFLLLVATYLLYIAGNFQRFLDTSQTTILRQLGLLAITLFLFSILSIISKVLDIIILKIPYKNRALKNIIALLFYSICAIISAVSIIASRAIIVISGGYY